jgi:hypothetical protein
MALPILQLRSKAFLFNLSDVVFEIRKALRKVIYELLGRSKQVYECLAPLA